jgi:hypothetical protein
LAGDIQLLPRSDLDAFNEGLQSTLKAHDIRVKRSNVRQLTAKLNGFDNWQQAVRTCDRSIVECFDGPTMHTCDWMHSFEVLADHCSKQSRSLPRELVVRANSTGLMLLARFPADGPHTAYDGIVAQFVR